MTRTELDDAIREVVGERETANVNSRVFKRWRRLWIAGMRAAADIADDHHSAELAADAIRRAADELEGK